MQIGLVILLIAGNPAPINRWFIQSFKTEVSVHAFGTCLATW